MIKTLAIETSCDDTSLGIISFDGKTFEVKQLKAYSQIKDHQQYGGVVPEIASRLHSEQILAVLNEVGKDNIKDIDCISVTTHPGLPGSLIVGQTIANMLGEYLNKPVIKVNHIYGHIFSLWLERNQEDIQLPLMVLTASGGHNDIYLMKQGENKEDICHSCVKVNGVLLKRETTWVESRNLNKIKLFGTLGNFKLYKLGSTLDDAAGECFDKAARMLGGPYPGGPRISQQADMFDQKSESEQKNIYQQLGITDEPGTFFNRVWLSADKFEFSFSGTKSQVHNFVDKMKKRGTELTEEMVQCIAYEFQESVVEVLAKKLVKAGLHHQVKTLGITGGVSANNRLVEYIQQLLKNENRLKNNTLSNESNYQDFIFLTPTKKIYSTDNAAMIGVVGILKFQNK